MMQRKENPVSTAPYRFPFPTRCCRRTGGIHPVKHAEGTGPARQHRQIPLASEEQLVRPTSCAPRPTASSKHGDPRAVHAQPGMGPIRRSDDIRSAGYGAMVEAIVVNGGGQMEPTSTRSPPALTPASGARVSHSLCAGARPSVSCSARPSCPWQVARNFHPPTYYLPPTAEHWMAVSPLPGPQLLRMKGVAQHYFDLGGGNASGSASSSALTPSQQRALRGPGRLVLPSLSRPRWTAALGGWRSGYEPPSKGLSMAAGSPATVKRRSRGDPLHRGTDLEVKGLMDLSARSSFRGGPIIPSPKPRQTVRKRFWLRPVGALQIDKSSKSTL